MPRLIGLVPFLGCCLSGCFQLMPCENEVLLEEASPDGRERAVAFTRDCGATTGTSYHVALLPDDEPLGDRAGNVFVAELEPGYARVLLGWPGDTLHVHYNAPREVFKAERTVNGRPVRFTAGDGIDIAPLPQGGT